MGTVLAWVKVTKAQFRVTEPRTNTMTVALRAQTILQQLSVAGVGIHADQTRPDHGETV